MILCNTHSTLCKQRLKKSHGAIMRSLGYVKYPTETCRNVSGKLLPVFWGVYRQEKYMSNIYIYICQLSSPWEGNSSLSSQEFSSQETTGCSFPASDDSKPHPFCFCKIHINIILTSVCTTVCDTYKHIKYSTICVSK